MPAPTVSTPNVGQDPGFLYWAPLGTAEPANTVVGSVFTDAWPAAYKFLGVTDAGSNFNFQTSVDQITYAELLDVVKYVSTGREGSFAFAMGDIVQANLKRALNGGTITQTGTGTTLLSKYTPPALGQEVRCMIGWESQDFTERILAYQCFNTAQVQITRAKGAARAVIPVEYALEVPSGAGSVPFAHWTAGVARAGAY